MTEIQANQKRGRRGYHLRHSKRPPPVYLIEPKTTFEDVARSLYAPGEIPRELHKLLRGDASPETIRDWRRGKYDAPQWALELIHQEITKRIAQQQAAANRLLRAKEKAGD